MRVVSRKHLEILNPKYLAPLAPIIFVSVDRSIRRILT